MKRGSIISTPFFKLNNHINLINYNYLLILTLGAHLLTAWSTCAHAAWLWLHVYRQPVHLLRDMTTDLYQVFEWWKIMKQLCCVLIKLTVIYELVWYQGRQHTKDLTEFMGSICYLLKNTLKVCRHLQHEITTGGRLMVCSNLWATNAWSLMILDSYLTFDVF